MSNLHRLHWIDACIRERRYPNARTIAGQFEISRRQAARDLEYLRYSMGAPLAYSAAKNGYFYTDDTYALPAYILSGKEKEALSYLAYRYRGTGSAQAERLAELFAALSGRGYDSYHGPPAGPDPQVNLDSATIFHALQGAVSANHRLEMEYLNSANVISRRQFDPYKVFFKNPWDYVVGYCWLRREIRVFRLDRIRSVRETGESFTVIHTYQPEQYGGDWRFNVKEAFTAEVRLEGVTLPAGWPFPAEYGGGGEWRMKFGRSDEFLHALLALAGSFKILHPRWLKERLRQLLIALLEENA